MSTLDDLDIRINDLQFQITECRNLGDYDLIPAIQAELKQKESAYLQLRVTAPDYNQIPF